MDYRNDKLHVGEIADQKGLIFHTIIPSRSLKIWSFKIKVGAQNWYTYTTDVRFINGCNIYQLNSEYSLLLSISEAGKLK